MIRRRKSLLPQLGICVIFGIIVGIVFFLCLHDRSMTFMAKADTPDKTLNFELAITIDDLPWVGPLPYGASIEEVLGGIADVLQAHKAPATGFVVSDHAVGNEVALRAWVDHGFYLGNHSALHRDLNSTPDSEWLADAALCTEFLKKFGHANTPYFRFPMLHQGDTLEKRNHVRSALQDMGLKTAHVTVDTSDWLLDRAYAFAVKSQDSSLQDEIRHEFIRHIIAAVEHADSVARRKAGRQVRQILLLHATALVHDNLDALLCELAARSVKFITLEKALTDSVYSLTDEYIGPKGLSWLYRMQPLSVADALWDDAETAVIHGRFSRALAADS